MTWTKETLAIASKIRKETDSKLTEICILSATRQHFKQDNAISSPSVNTYQFMSHSVNIQQLGS